MRIITAPDPLDIKDNDVVVFLAGGITNCPNWQKEVIDLLQRSVNRYSNLVILNPRRENFPIDDPNAAEEQITWEFNALERCTVFSMYFSDGNSDQPICMYELGRNIVRMQMKYPIDWQDRLIISTSYGYKRYPDVLIQTELACGTLDKLLTSPYSKALIEYYAGAIIDTYKQLKQRGTH